MFSLADLLIYMESAEEKIFRGPKRMWKEKKAYEADNSLFVIIALCRHVPDILVKSTLNTI